MLTHIPPMGTTTPAVRSNHLRAFLRQHRVSDFTTGTGRSHAGTGGTMTPCAEMGPSDYAKLSG